MILKTLFWIAFIAVLYTYIGYGVLLFILVKVKGMVRKRSPMKDIQAELPEVTLLIAAYNEMDCIPEKLANTRNLQYPASKLHSVWVTDGSDDGSVEYLQSQPDVKVLHQPLRAGKIGAINRAMQQVQTPIVVFCDANTFLSSDSIYRMVLLFTDPRVGCVSGEKRVKSSGKDSASGAGEGIYWKYESKLKQWDSELNSVVGAAGELFAIRTGLFEPVEADTLLDDFMISLRIASKGYLIKYDAQAWAAEAPSADIREELKRKIRISAGAIQSMIRLRSLLNPLKNPLLSFQYISHRVLRWTLAPLGLLVIALANLLIVLNEGLSLHSFYTWSFLLQILFYLAAMAGYYFEHRQIRFRILFVPFFFFIMNYAVYRGFFRYIRNKQHVNWEKARRASK